MSDFLNSGEQTKISENISAVAAEIEGVGLSAIMKILAWIHKNIKLDEKPDFKKENFRKRTAEEIINSRRATGCTDYALAFLTIARAKGIPTKYVETINADWLSNPDFNALAGHVFVEVFFDGEWFIVDPQGACLKAWYGKRFKKIGEGLDSWDLEIRGFDDLKKVFEKFLKEKNLEKI
ncbi:MAG: transglutaminase-like domain-containing protein [Candidatus Pacebacteria bacterium]|nr:transglutaminase-like domain-containing protein [Candidatus Paceibacterota bacterium]